MDDLITTALSMTQERAQQEMAVSLLRMKAVADQKIAAMLMENARQIAAASEAAAARGGIDIYV